MRIHKLFPPLMAAMVAVVVATAPASAEKTVIRISHAAANDVGTDQQMMAWIFANYVNTYSDSLDARIFPNNQLGESRAVIEAMQLGSGSSLHIGGMAEFANFCKKCGVLGLPLIWKNYEHIHKTLDGEVGDVLKGEMEKVGFKVLAYGDSWGYRNVVTAKKQVTKAEDLKGLKIRTIPTPIFVGAINAMGASAAPMNFGEIYTSLQTGVLDGFEHTAATVMTNKFYEIAKYVALTRHLFDPTVMAFSRARWEELDDKQKETVLKAAKVASDVVRALAPIREAESLAQLTEKGMTVSEIDMAPIRKNARAAQQELAEKIGAADLLQKILAE
ncbi:TRAP transporter substrate-binding protein [Shumkonia mesophila]|uniref:TRAP transporter substrate-binding protein n=1 Tax=Shumkonia mesophila TaxID=2838854 RepID=UPI00293434C0|nr:TRAP transporter substrate-binding protein [Shumkonia mesophila]